MIKNPLGREGINLETLPKSHSLRFAEKHYDITPLYNLNEMFKLNRMCDKFVLGSDQMWNYGLSKPYRQSYYFDFVEDEKKAISYANVLSERILIMHQRNMRKKYRKILPDLRLYLYEMIFPKESVQRILE